MQILKNNIKLQIENAAIGLFSSSGYEKSGMAEIARLAGISAGNVYRYYSNKQELLDSIISKDFVQSCFAILNEKIGQVKGLGSDQIATSEEFAHGNLQLLDFLIRNRLRLVILMKGCPGTRLENFCESIRTAIVKAVSEHFVAVGKAPDKEADFPECLLLDTIYKNLINATLVILGSKTSDRQCRKTLQKLMAYHLGGLSSFA